LSVTELKVPSVVESATVAPPVTMLTPPASFNWTVIALVVIPFAKIEPVEAVIVEAKTLTVPDATKFTVSVSVIAVAPSDPETVAVVIEDDDVKIAEYVPSPLSVTADKVPAVVESNGTQADFVRLFPAPSFSCTTIPEVLVPLATIEPGVALIIVVATAATSIFTGALGNPAQLPLLTILRMYRLEEVTAGS
jgi:hypothetical protein